MRRKRPSGSTPLPGSIRGREHPDRYDAREYHRSLQPLRHGEEAR